MTISVIGSWPLRVLHVLPVCFWSLAILLAIPTVVPVDAYCTTLGNPLAGKSIYVHTVLRKLVWLRLCLFLQLAGIVAMLIVLWLRLSGMTGLTAGYEV